MAASKKEKARNVVFGLIGLILSILFYRMKNPNLYTWQGSTGQTVDWSLFTNRVKITKGDGLGEMGTFTGDTIKWDNGSTWTKK